MRLVDFCIGYERLTEFLLEENARLRDAATEVRFPLDYQDALDGYARRILREAVEQGGTYGQAAKLVGLERHTMIRRCHQFGIISRYGALGAA
jgi:transcriptional regulator of acetoin/glycerol metabolism